MTGYGVRAITLVTAAFLAQASGLSIATAQAQQQVAQRQYSFDIPAKPITQAVNDIGRIAGLSVVFSENRPITSTGNPVRGAMGAAQALATLLAGTGLTYEFSNPSTVQILDPAAAADGQPFSADGTTMLDPITIYGAPNATTLGSTSTSVGVVTAREMEQSQIRTFRETFRRLGNVQDSAYISSGFVIRGMSSEGFVPGGSPVGSLYIDGVLQTRVNARRAPRAVWDMEQVEVYRGPQSTLSGRAAMTGAIYLKSKDPTFNQAAEVSGTVGTDNLVGTAFLINTPVVEDQVALRIAGSFERSKSPVNFPTYEHFTRYDDYTTDLSYNIRGKMLITPSELPDTRALLTYSFAKENPVDRFIGTGIGFGLEDNRGDFYRWPTHAEYRPIKANNAGLEVTHDFSDTLRFTSLTGVNYGASQRLSVDLGSPGVVTGINGTIDDLLASQELRLNYEGDRWTWVGGLYGSYQNTDTELDIVLPTGVIQRQVTGGKTTNLAAFGEATYEFVPTWNVTLGGRIDYLRLKENQFASQRSGVIFVSRQNDADLDELNFVPKIGLSKDLAEGHTTGVTYSQGFRTGGYYINQRTLDAHYYEPEKAHSYELFYKGRFLEDRLKLNANLFYTKYSNQQIEVRPDPNDGFYRETQNAASSQAWGFEVEPTWQVTDRFSAFASLGFLKAEFLDFNHASYGDLAGQPLPEAPEWSVGFGGTYQFENGFYVGSDAKYTSSYLATFGIAPQDKIDSRIIVNTQVGYRADNWEANVFVENLFDERYYTGMDMEAVPAFAQIGPPRSVGLNIKAKF